MLALVVGNLVRGFVVYELPTDLKQDVLARYLTTVPESQVAEVHSFKQLDKEHPLPEPANTKPKGAVEAKHSGSGKKEAKHDHAGASDSGAGTSKSGTGVGGDEADAGLRHLSDATGDVGGAGRSEAAPAVPGKRR